MSIGTALWDYAPLRIKMSIFGDLVGGVWTCVYRWILGARLCLLCSGREIEKPCTCNRHELLEADRRCTRGRPHSCSVKPIAASWIVDCLVDLSGLSRMT